MIGITLNDRYLIEEKVGGGGMANVYKAHDNRLGRHVAIKILKQEFVDDEEFVENFRRESHSAAKLNHQNIVGVFDVGNDEINGQKIYYIVMEIVHGKTLKEIVLDKGKLSIAETLNYAIQISEGILCAHDNGIIHRDIKPQNIIVNRENIPKVTDFGIAQGANKNTTSERDIMGSVHYFSPEQAKGEKTDERSDIYSLGLLLYEMVTGQLPFHGDNPISIALKQVHEEIKIPSSINHEVPKLLDNIIIKMTNKDPQARYDNLKDVITDLKALEKKTELEMSNTLIIPNVNRVKRDPNISVDDQRRIRRTGIESSNVKRKEYSSNNLDQKKKKGGILPIIVGILLALIVATSAFVFFLNLFVINKDNKVEEIVVPNLIGEQEDVARGMIEDLELQFEVTERKINHNYPPGSVIYQSVKEGTKVKEGYTIRVNINSESLGIVEVGIYVDLKVSDAIEQIEKDGLKYKIENKEVEDEDQVDRVLDQDLREGTKVERNTTVYLTVGRAKEVETVTMLDLIGVNSNDAVSTLKEMGLKVKVTTGVSNKFDLDDVISQSVLSGEEVEVGSVVELVKAVKDNTQNPEENIEDEDNEVNENNEETPEQVDKNPVESEVDKNPDNPETLDPTTPTEPDTPTEVTTNLKINIPDDMDSVKISIKKIDKGKEIEVYSGTHSSSEGTIVIPVTGSKDAIFQVFADGYLQEPENE